MNAPSLVSFRMRKHLHLLLTRITGVLSIFSFVQNRSVPLHWYILSDGLKNMILRFPLQKFRRIKKLPSHNVSCVTDTTIFHFNFSFWTYRRLTFYLIILKWNGVPPLVNNKWAEVVYFTFWLSHTKVSLLFFSLFLMMRKVPCSKGWMSKWWSLHHPEALSDQMT